MMHVVIGLYSLFCLTAQRLFFFLRGKERKKTSNFKGRDKLFLFQSSKNIIPYATVYFNFDAFRPTSPWVSVNILIIIY